MEKLFKTGRPWKSCSKQGGQSSRNMPHRSVCSQVYSATNTSFLHMSRKPAGLNCSLFVGCQAHPNPNLHHAGKRSHPIIVQFRMHHTTIQKLQIASSSSSCSTNLFPCILRQENMVIYFDGRLEKRQIWWLPVANRNGDSSECYYHLNINLYRLQNK